MKHTACLLCARDSEVVPILTLAFRGSKIRVCSQHLPVLIHDPGRLIGILPGAEKLEPSEHAD